MSRRSSHAAKTQGEKVAYNRRVMFSASEPTVDESLDFQISSKTEIEEKTPPQKKRRRSSTVQIISHIEANWVAYLLSMLVLIGGYFMFEGRENLAVLDITIKDQQRQLDRLDLDLRSIVAEMKLNNSDDLAKIRELDAIILRLNEINATQDIILRELQLRLEFIEEAQE